MLKSQTPVVISCGSPWLKCASQFLTILIWPMRLGFLPQGRRYPLKRFRALSPFLCFTPAAAPVGPGRSATFPGTRTGKIGFGAIESEWRCLTSGFRSLASQWRYFLAPIMQSADLRAGSLHAFSWAAPGIVSSLSGRVTLRAYSITAQRSTEHCCAARAD